MCFVFSLACPFYGVYLLLILFLCISRSCSVETPVHDPYRSAPAGDMKHFQSMLHDAKNILIIIGEELTKASGCPVLSEESNENLFNEKVFKLETVDKPVRFINALKRAWQIYNNFRAGVAATVPNAAHFAIAALQKRYAQMGRNVTIVTYLLDSLMTNAGATNVLEVEGNIYKFLCIRCKKITETKVHPYAEVLSAIGPAPQDYPDVPDLPHLPRCKNQTCNGLLLPFIFLVAEDRPNDIVDAANAVLRTCDLGIVIGLHDGLYQQIAGYLRKDRGVTVFDFSQEKDVLSCKMSYWIQGDILKTIPEALK